jgi:hypothetical protein
MMRDFMSEERLMRRGTGKNLARKALILALTLMVSGSGSALAQRPDTGAAPTAIKSAQDLEQWMSYYYLHPQPELLVNGLIFADTNGLVASNPEPLAAFVSRVFAQNPKRIKTWVNQLQPTISVQSVPMLLSALWWSNTPEGREALNELVQRLPEKSQGVILGQMANSAQPIESRDFKSEAIVHELWAAYSATGDEKYVTRVMSVLPWSYDTNDINKLQIGGAARWSLASNAAQHPKVKQLCLKARDTHPEWKKALDAVLAQVNKNSVNQQASTRNTQ